MPGRQRRLWGRRREVAMGGENGSLQRVSWGAATRVTRVVIEFIQRIAGPSCGNCHGINAQKEKKNKLPVQITRHSILYPTGTKRVIWSLWWRQSRHSSSNLKPRSSTSLGKSTKAANLCASPPVRSWKRKPSNPSPNLRRSPSDRTITLSSTNSRFYWRAPFDSRVPPLPVLGESKWVCNRTF